MQCFITFHVFTVRIDIVSSYQKNRLITLRLTYRYSLETLIKNHFLRHRRQLTVELLNLKGK